MWLIVNFCLKNNMGYIYIGNSITSESAKYSKHLINRVLHGAPIIEVIFLREEKPVLALLMLSAKQGSHWYHF